ncbi:hypothetical protein JXA70_03310 [candidate division KSB1 bacterium]|nr:hypothetical protein [candidate division KSB1 bacterium]
MKAAGRRIYLVLGKAPYFLRAKNIRKYQPPIVLDRINTFFAEYQSKYILMQHKADFRDHGLDLLRFTALTLMVFAHYPLASDTAFISQVKFIADSAPALFYFAFGMTFKHFARKSKIVQTRILFVFLVIALLHNLTFTGHFVHYEFFFFLWFSQLVMMLVSSTKKPVLVCQGFIMIIIVLWLILPDGFTSNTFKVIARGNFPFLPWLIFVCAGYVFNNSNSKSWSLPFVLILAAIILFRTDVPHFSIRKYPLSISYFFLFCGITMTLYRVGTMATVLSQNRMVVYISKNLLLATILHYLTFTVYNVIRHSARSLLRFDLASIHKNVAILLAPTLCLIILIVLIAAVRYFWRFFDTTPVLDKWILPHTGKMSVAIMAVCTLLTGISAKLPDALLKLCLFLGMIFLAMLLRKVRSAQKMDLDFFMTA